MNPEPRAVNTERLLHARSDVGTREDDNEHRRSERSERFVRTPPLALRLRPDLNSGRDCGQGDECSATKRFRFMFSLFSLLPVLLLSACGPSTESSKNEESIPGIATKEMLYKRGHQLYLQQNLDSAQAALQQALALDANYQDVLADLAPLHYELAMRTDAAKKKNELLRRSREYYVKLESFGTRESDLYERICEIANVLNDDKTFLKYAKKNADAYPYDRQYYNLSVAYFNVGDYANVMKSMKEAVGKFQSSTFIGSFYRQLGRAYMKIDRDQTAEKTFYSGLSAVDMKMAELRKANTEYKTSADYARLRDDKVGMLISLKNLHTTYKATAKLAEVEKKLKELGR